MFKDPWHCLLCVDVSYFDPRALVDHVLLWHDEWVTGRQVPPMRPSAAF